MSINKTIAAWKNYGVLITQDAAGYWSWAETDEQNNENEAFSPAFATLETALQDLESCFGPLNDQVAKAMETTR